MRWYASTERGSGLIGAAAGGYLDVMCVLAQKGIEMARILHFRFPVHPVVVRVDAWVSDWFGELLID